MKIHIKNLFLRNFLSVGNDGLSVEYKEGLFRVKGTNLDTNDTNGVGKCVDGETIVDVMPDEEVLDLFKSFINIKE